MITKNKHLVFPFQIGKNGRTLQVSSLEEHIKQEIIQLVLTDPGERLFLPEFGGGVNRLIFTNLSDSRIVMAKSLLAQAFSKWLGNRITIQDLKMTVENETILIDISYRINETNESYLIKFQKEG
jgi:hypothetical protein